MKRKLIFLFLICITGAVMAQKNTGGKSAAAGPIIPVQYESICTPSAAGSGWDVGARYKSCIHEHADPVSDFPTAVGDETCTRPFGFKVKMVQQENVYIDGVNGERAKWNHKTASMPGSNMAFYQRTNPNANEFTLNFIGKYGGFLFSHVFVKQNFYVSGNVPSYVGSNMGTGWKRVSSTIRWHPTEQAIIYPRDNRLIKREVTSSGLGAETTLAIFGDDNGGSNPTYDFVIGSLLWSDNAGEVRFNQKIAGGDGNDVNGGRMLISLVPDPYNIDPNPTGPDGIINENIFLVYDFNTNQLITQNITWGGPGSYSETPITANGANNRYTTPQINTHGFSFAWDLTDFDYGQVTPSGLFVATRQAGEGFQLYDFDGNLLSMTDDLVLEDDAFSMPSHYDLGYLLVEDDNGNEVVRECVIAKANDGSADDLNALTGCNTALYDCYNSGDVFALYWYPDPNGGTDLQLGVYSLLHWEDPYKAEYSASQFSAVSDEQSAQPDMFGAYSVSSDHSYRILACMASVHPDYDDEDVSIPVNWGPYFGEIIEFSLNHNERKYRRIVHHYVVDRFDYEPDDCFDRNISPCGTNEDCISDPSNPNYNVCYEGSPSERASFQPEAWLSPDGTRFLFKSSGEKTDYETDANHNEQNLYFVELPERGLVPLSPIRDCNGTHFPYRETSIEKPDFHIYPNPVDQGFLLIQYQQDQLKGFPARITLTGVDGRSQNIWTGELSRSQPLKLSMQTYASGIYFLQILNTQTGLIEQTEKVVIP